MKKILFSLFILFLTVVSYAQQTSASGYGGSQYQRALGIKFAAGGAVSYKQFVANTRAIEAEAMFFSEGVRLIGLYEFHFNNIPGVEGLSWYAGPGAHVGFYKPSGKIKYNTAADVGIDGVIGLDYKVKNLPINLSLDWQPSYSLVGSAGLEPQFGGLAIRYVLQ